MAFFGGLTLTDIERLTLREYMLRMKAYELSRIEQLELMSIEALWASRAGATDRNGKYVIKTPSQLFDKHKQEIAILGTRTIKELEERKRLATLTRKVQALEEGEEDV